MLKPRLEWLLVLIPISIGLEVLGGRTWPCSSPRAPAIIPLAGLIGRGTEQLALHAGPRVAAC